ncbi:hypothetical protein MG293_005055 [Ovis ammon polii]|uniref:Uncharacterized protein n=1 Tax=Ovis ammon polii TaxID=230172 RepID=A0AAD4UJ97_OVIAM|nr:hypothetical protein MG293_005055 [Ovis ammon polii]
MIDSYSVKAQMRLTEIYHNRTRHRQSDRKDVLQTNRKNAPKTGKRTNRMRSRFTEGTGRSATEHAEGFSHTLIRSTLRKARRRLHTSGWRNQKVTKCPAEPAGGAWTLSPPLSPGQFSNPPQSISQGNPTTPNTENTMLVRGPRLLIRKLGTITASATAGREEERRHKAKRMASDEPLIP